MCMVLTPAWEAGVGRAIVWVVFVCRLGRVARLASPHDTARFTSMVFTLGALALLDLFGGAFAPPPPRKHEPKHQTRIPLCWFWKIETTILRPTQKAWAFACQVDKRKVDVSGRVFTPSPPRKHRRIEYNCRPAWLGGKTSEPRRHRSLHFYGCHAWRDGLA